MAGKRRWIWAVILALAAGGWWWTQSAASVPDKYTFEIVRQYPHDPAAFTQGLIVHDGQLYEGTGQYGESELRKVDLKSGRVLQRVALDDDLFGEGIAVVDDQIVQLTWKGRQALVYQHPSLDRLPSRRYRGEGWGLTYDGKRLVMSDGSSVLTFRNPTTFEEVGKLVVTSDGQRVENLNELEYVRGQIWANIWFQDRIAQISPRTGKVLAWIDLSELYPASERRDRDAVLNGIAYDQQNDRLFVTGKYWPHLFEIRVVENQ